jgi:hypothetical protein
MDQRRESRDHGRVGQIAHAGPMRRSGVARLVAGGAASVLAAGVAGAVVVSGGSSASAAVTVVHHPRAATILAPDGRTSAAHDGARLRPGDVLRTAADGFATLLTDGRREYVAGGSSVLVRDGERQQVRAGALVADLRSGPSLDVLVSGSTVRATAGDVVRIEHGFTVRVGALAGDVVVRSPAGRSAAVPALHQVRINADALPDDAPAPLALVDDEAERATNLPVVVDDVLLHRWAVGSAADTAAQPRLAAAVAALPAVNSSATQCLPPVSAPVSERVLPVAIARSSHDRMSLGDRYGRALCDRAEGGSWGVVAHLMETTAVRTLAQVDALQSDRLLALGAQTGVPRAGVIAPPAAPGDGPATGGRQAPSEPTTAPRSSGGSAAPPPSTGPTPPPSGGLPSPAPSPVPTPPPPDTGVIGNLVGAVAGVLPPAPSPAPSLPAPGGGFSGTGLLGAPLLGLRVSLLAAEI